MSEASAAATLVQPAAPGIFTLTKRLRDAVSLVDRLPPKRLAVLVTRCATHIKDKTSSIFTPDEMSQLCTVLSLSSSEAHLLLEALSYILESSAYNLLSADKLNHELSSSLGMGENASRVVSHIWGEQRDALLSNMRERSFGTPLILDSVHYRTGLTLATESSSKRKDIHAVLSLGLRREGEPQATDKDALAATPAPICVELNTEGLQGLYETLEKIQGQLDALTDKPA